MTSTRPPWALSWPTRPAGTAGLRPFGAFEHLDGLIDQLLITVGAGFLQEGGQADRGCPASIARPSDRVSASAS
jgi:hypothetical protein